MAKRTYKTNKQKLGLKLLANAYYGLPLINESIIEKHGGSKFRAEVRIIEFIEAGYLDKELKITELGYQYLCWKLFMEKRTGGSGKWVP